MDKTAEQMVLDKLNELSVKIDKLTSEGCPMGKGYADVKSNQSDIFERLRKIELAQAEGRGKLAVAMIFLTALVSFIFQWIGKHF